MSPDLAGVLVVVGLVMALVLIFFRSVERPPVSFSRDGIRYRRFLGSGFTEIPWSLIATARVRTEDGDYPVEIELRPEGTQRLQGFIRRGLAVQLAAEIAYYAANPAARSSLPDASASVPGALVPVSEAELAPFRSAVDAPSLGRSSSKS